MGHYPPGSPGIAIGINANSQQTLGLKMSFTIDGFTCHVVIQNRQLLFVKNIGMTYVVLFESVKMIEGYFRVSIVLRQVIFSWSPQYDD